MKKIPNFEQLEKELKDGLTDGRNGVFYHWHPWTVRDMLCVAMPIIKKHFESAKKNTKAKATV